MINLSYFIARNDALLLTGVITIVLADGGLGAGMYNVDIVPHHSASRETSCAHTGDGKS